MPKHDRQISVDETDARAGSNDGVVRWVLLISLTLAIIALTAIWVTGALSQGPVESEGTATGRIEEQREQASPQTSSIDGVTVDSQDAAAAAAGRAE